MLTICPGCGHVIASLPTDIVTCSCGERYSTYEHGLLETARVNAEASVH